MTNNKQHKGFTLIETLVAVMILATALAGPLTVASRSLNAALIAKDQIAAYYLAQDAVEYVRFIRDSNKLAGLSWLAGLDGVNANSHTNGGGVGSSCISADGSVSCSVDTAGDTTAVCVSGVCPAIKFNTTTNFYDSSGSVLPAYIRKITITSPVGAQAGEAKLTVSVKWTDVGGITHPGVTVQEDLFDWQ